MGDTMNEKSTLLPTAPADDRFVPSSSQPEPNSAGHTTIRVPSIVIMPGLEFDPNRKLRYGLHSLVAAGLVFVSFLLVEFRGCNAGVQIDLDRLQALHVSLMVFAFVVYLMSLFGIADFSMRYKMLFAFGVLLMYTFAGLMVWMTYEAAVNPCVSSFTNIPVDFVFQENKNVFSRGDAIGIVVLFLDIVATIFMISAATSYSKGC